MRALILGGGFSTRLGALTETTPKGLLDIQGSPMMAQILDQILAQRAAGHISEICLVSNSRYFSVFQSWLNEQNLAEIVKLIDDGAQTNETRLGAIGDLALVLHQLGWSDDLLVVSSDTRTSLELQQLMDFFSAKRACVNAVFDTHDLEVIRGKLGNVLLDGSGQITTFVEKPLQPISTLTSIPYYIFTQDSLELVLEFIQSGASTDSPGSLIQWLAAKVPVYGYVVDGYYMDVGTPEMLERARRGV